MRTARIFVSSTFNDFVEERNILHERVFPQLERLCRRRGCSFQPIDLRWGISARDSEDYTALDICLREVRRCQQMTPRPNFIFLAGDRYGWRPLPTTIAGGLAERLLAEAAPDERAQIMASYDWDENAVPRALRLRVPDEVACQKALHAVAARLALAPEERTALFASATHRELLERLSLQELPSSAVCAVRTLVHVPPAECGRYFDLLPDGRIDNEAQAGARELRALVSRAVPDAIAYTIDLAQDADQRHAALEVFADEVLERLSAYLEAEFAREDGDLVAGSHEAYARRLGAGFVAREGELDHMVQLVTAQHAESAASEAQVGTRAGELRRGLRRLADFFGRRRGKAESRPPASAVPPFLVLRGSAGCGKTYLMAKLAERLAALTQPEPGSEPMPGSDPAPASTLPSAQRPLVRFVGLTGDSTSCAKLLADVERRAEMAPLVVDAVDMLDKPLRFVDTLRLRPRTAPVILSMGDDCYERCLSRLPQDVHTIVLPPITADQMLLMVRAHLATQGRTITQSQCDAVMASYAHTGDAHLVDLLVKRAARLASYEGAEALEQAGGTQVLAAETLANLTRRDHFGDRLAHRVVSYLLASRGGLTDKELYELLCRDHQVVAEFERTSQHALPAGSRSLPFAYVSRVFYAVLPLLVERWSEGEVVYRFGLAAVEAAARSFCAEEDEQATHGALADYFLAGRAELPKAALRQMLAALSGESSSPTPSRFAFELPYQLRKAGRYEELYELLCDREVLTFMHGWGFEDYLRAWAVVRQHTGHTPAEGFSELVARARVAVELGERLDDADLHAAVCLSDLLAAQGGDAAVLTTLTQARVIAAGEGAQDALQAQYQQVQALIDAGQNVEALKRAEELYRSTPPALSVGYASVLYAYGQALYRTEAYELASSVFRVYQELAQELGNRAHQFTALKWVASCEKAQNHLDEALALYARLEDEYGEDGDLSELVPVYFEAASASSFGPDGIEKALAYYSRCEQLCLKLGNRPWLVTLYQTELSTLSLAQRPREVLELFPRYIDALVATAPGTALNPQYLECYLRAAYVCNCEGGPRALRTPDLLWTLECFAFMQRAGALDEEAIAGCGVTSAAPLLQLEGYRYAMSVLPEALRKIVAQRPADPAFFVRRLNDAWADVFGDKGPLFPAVGSDDFEATAQAVHDGSTDDGQVRNLRAGAAGVAYCMHFAYSMYDWLRDCGDDSVYEAFNLVQYHWNTFVVAYQNQLRYEEPFFIYKRRRLDYAKELERLRDELDRKAHKRLGREDAHVRKLGEQFAHTLTGVPKADRPW